MEEKGYYCPTPAKVKSRTGTSLNTAKANPGEPSFLSFHARKTIVYIYDTRDKVGGRRRFDGNYVPGATGSSVQGQSVDYGALQQLFKEPVTTSVTGSPQWVSEVPATMEIITAEGIRRSGAKDILGVLPHVGGVDTLEWGNGRQVYAEI